MIKQIIEKYFLENPDKKSEVIKAHYAYHRSYAETKSHYFHGASKDSECRFCGRTRSDVRWDDLVPECLNRPDYMDSSIESVIKKEEILFQKVLDRALKIASEITDINLITGEDLSVYHHTHGVDPSMLECALLTLGKQLPEYLHEEYRIAYQTHSATGKLGEKKIIIKAKIKNET